MDVIPVIDLMDGIVVRGVAGRRDEYRAVHSKLTDDAAPLSVSAAFREHLGLSKLYLADLDGIRHGRPRLDIYHALATEGFALLIDAGLRNVTDAQQFFDAGAAAVIAGLETSDGPAQLRQLCETFGAGRIVFSLDLKAGCLLNPSKNWRSDDPFEVAQRAIDAGVRRMIVLDLAGVGTGSGVPTASMCARLKAKFAELELVTGGGVRGIEDLRSLKEIGVDGVLVSSTLHDGTIGRAEIHSLRSNVSG